MKFEIKMSPEELVYMAVRCEGENLDYEYVNMMKDVQVRGSIAEEDIIDRIIEKGLAEENWGDVSFNEIAIEALSPIWNGNFQAIIEIKGRDSIERTIRIHKKDGRYVIVEKCGDELNVKTADSEEIEEIADMLKKENGKFITLGNLMIDKGHETIEEFVVKEDQMYRPQGEGNSVLISDAQYTDIAVKTLKGE